MFAKKVISILAIFALLVPNTIFAENFNVVRDKDGDIVISILAKTCVRTRWETSSDPCDPKDPVITHEPLVLPREPKKLEELNTEDKTVYFEFNKAVLTPEATRHLDLLIDSVKNSNKVVKARIYGHADHIGDSEYNMELSKKRAKAVEDYLESKGEIDSSVVDLEAFGETQPVANCEKRQTRKALIKCLEKDRRVQIELDVKRSIIRE